MFIDYSVADNCQNLEDSYGEICVKCGKCGRKFEQGYLLKDDQEPKDEKNNTK